MKVDKIELFHVNIPLDRKRPGFFGEHACFLPSWVPGFPQSDVRFYLLKLTTDDGHEGHAAMPAIGTERHGLGPILGSYLLGINPLDIRLVNQRIQEFSFIGMRNGWIDAAFWDLIGKIRGEPLWKILGGTGGHVFPYMSTGATHGHDPAVSRQLARSAGEAGYGGIKLRVKGTNIDEMVQYVAAAREELGEEAALMVDCNQGWPVDIVDETPKWDVEFVLKFAEALEPLNLKWLEEPLNRGNFEGLARVRSQRKVPLAGGEVNSSWRDFLAMLDEGSLDYYQPDAVLAGGTYGGGISMVSWLIREIGTRNSKGEGNKVRYCPHTWTTGLGFAVALHLVGVLPAEERSLFEYPMEGHWNPENWARFIRGGFPVDDRGRIKIPDGPGLGVELDTDVIKRFGHRIYTGTAARVAVQTLRDHGWRKTMHLKERKNEQLARTARATFSLPDPPY